MPFKLTRRSSIIFAITFVLVLIIGYFVYLETQNSIKTSPIPTENPNINSTPLVANYTVTIPEIYEVGFGVAEINLQFIAPSSSLQQKIEINELNYSTHSLPVTFSTNPDNMTNLTLPALPNETRVDITVNIYQYTMILDNPRILVASSHWNETKYVYE